MDKDKEIAELKREIKRLQKIIDSHEDKSAKSSTVKPKFYGIFEGKRILLVEDILITREIVSQMLSITKVKIDTAENGFEAIEKFTDADGNYDLILMDIQMPIMDGCTATQKIKNLPFERAKTTPIIAITANISPEDIEKYRNAGMISYIGKPINRDTLINKMAQYFG